jgi:UDP-3-O-[3-hydroxymyristoyl] glucosamine N-acyltransferase
MYKSVKKEEVIEALEYLEVEYDLKGEAKSSYRPASLFNPIPKGLYFLVEDVDSFQAEDSLIIAKTTQIKCPSTNALIIIDRDPQTVFYKILDMLFGRKSTGEICDTSRIGEDVKIGNNVQIGSFCVVKRNCKIGNGTIIGSNTVIHENTTIGDDVIIGENTSVGASGMAWTWSDSGEGKVVQPQLGGVLIKDKCRLGAQSVVVRGSLSERTVVGERTLIAPGVRLGHGTQVGAYTHFANDVVTGGNTKVGEYCFVGSSATFRPKVRISDNTIVGAGAVVVKDTTSEGLTLMGVPAEEFETKENPSGMPSPRSSNQQSA